MYPVEESLRLRVECSAADTEEPDSSAEQLPDLASDDPVYQRSGESVAGQIAELCSFLQLGKQGTPVDFLNQKRHGEHYLGSDFLHGRQKRVRAGSLAQICDLHTVDQKQDEPDCELVDMAHGQDREGIPARMDLYERSGALIGVEHYVAVGKHHSLGCSGGSACVDDRGDVILRRSETSKLRPVCIRRNHYPGICSGCIAESLRIGACRYGHRRHVLHPDYPDVTTFQLGCMLCVDHDKACLTVLQDAPDLMGAEIGQHGNGYSPCPVHRKIGQAPVGTAFAQYGDLVVLSEAFPAEVEGNVDG